MQHKKTWVVVANGSSARIFNLSKGELTETNLMTHPESRMHGHELVTDRPGQTFASSGWGQHSMEPTTQPKKVETQHFAKEVAQYLDLHHRKGEYEQLHVIASPAFLGLLRLSLHAETQKSILSEVDKDLVAENPLQIRSYLP